ncbi:hypothetical protein Tsubulata_046615 [Turnera subulata]|uniref:Uncharacterized protein n=1 Tax=Turnera subulata TaxID=218843 RepID=A0A9Q0G343_9ROSI|nr:hypothetical protein Tsubulata_046615 [Turnera subulata]
MTASLRVHNRVFCYKWKIIADRQRGFDNKTPILDRIRMDVFGNLCCFTKAPLTLSGSIHLFQRDTVSSSSHNPLSEEANPHYVKPAKGRGTLSPGFSNPTEIFCFAQRCTIRNMISDAIRDGAEGFFRTQYGTISKMAFLLALVILCIYIYSALLLLSKSLLALGGLHLPILYCRFIPFGGLVFRSGVAGYVGMWVSLRANVAIRAGGFSAIVVVGVAVIGIAILYATFYVWLDVDSPGSMKVCEILVEQALMSERVNAECEPWVVASRGSTERLKRKWMWDPPLQAGGKIRPQSTDFTVLRSPPNGCLRLLHEDAMPLHWQRNV